MKTIKYIFATALIALAASSCTDLDVDVKSELTEYPTQALEGKMADAYYAFRTQLGNNYNRYQTFSSDEATGLSLTSPVVSRSATSSSMS